MVSSKFILVKHEALKRGTHFDLRFRMPNSKNWVSFALNTSPPTEPGKRMSIVRTNDHSEKEALFVGKIPEGEYGAGKLTKIDGGDCKIIKFTNAQMTVNFEGTVLQGTYHFINVGVFDRSRNYSKKVYVFFKAKNQQVNESSTSDVLKKHFSDPATYIRSLIASLIWLVLMFGIIFLSKGLVKSLNKQIDKKMTNRIRKIVGDNEINIYKCLYNEVNAFCDGTPNLYYFQGIVSELKLTENELMAIMLHEYGHYKENHLSQVRIRVIGSSTLSTAVVNLINVPAILRYILTTYSNLLVSFPINRSLKYTEVEADTYPGKFGYSKDFISALKKVKKYLYKKMCINMSEKKCDEYMNRIHYWDPHPTPNERLKTLSGKLLKLTVSLIDSNRQDKIDFLINKLQKLLIKVTMKSTTQFIDKDILSRL